MSAKQTPATPRTDAQPAINVYDFMGNPYSSTLVTRDFARTLELEAAHAGKLAEAAEELIQAMTPAIFYKGVSLTLSPADHIAIRTKATALCAQTAAYAAAKKERAG